MNALGRAPPGPAESAPGRYPRFNSPPYPAAGGARKGTSAMRKRHVIEEYRPQLGTHDEVLTLCGATIPIRKGLVDPDDIVTHSSKTACETCAMKANEQQHDALVDACTEVPG